MKTRAMYNGIPINLFLYGRICLVVGGGRVAFHKVELLVDSGAEVLVVSPELCSELKRLVGLELITHRRKIFEPDDTDGAILVYAATGSRHVNRNVLESCRAKSILCCCVDGNWEESDFTTPAIIRHGQLTVSVSSGGNNCRRSKMVKNNLARHLELLDAAHFIVVGTDHHHLAVEEREAFHLIGQRYERTGFMIMQLWGVHEFLILNTCNRVEVIAMVSRKTAQNGILPHSMGFTSLKQSKYYLLTGGKAFEHLCLVTAGMLSQTPGENHITAQMKEALESAKERGWADNMMQGWISSALYVSKLIKNEVEPMLRHIEIEDLAMRYLKACGKDLNQSTILLLGTGMIGKSLIRKSLSEVGKMIWCYHVNKPEWSERQRNKMELCTFNEMKNRIAEADVIISAADVPGHVLRMAHAPYFNPMKPVILIDLGMPRNIDPEIDKLSAEISVIDLDGLKYWYRQELSEMDEVLARSRAIAVEHQYLHEKIANSFQCVLPGE